MKLLLITYFLYITAECSTKMKLAPKGHHHTSDLARQKHYSLVVIFAPNIVKMYAKWALKWSKTRFNKVLYLLHLRTSIQLFCTYKNKLLDTNHCIFLRTEDFSYVHTHKRFLTKVNTCHNDLKCVLRKSAHIISGKKIVILMT